MAQPTSPGVPTGPPLRPSVTRSDSISSTNSAHSTVSLKRRSRTRTRTLTTAGRRGKSVGPAFASRTFGTEHGVVSEPEVPPLPTRSPRRPRTAALKPIILPEDLRERKTSSRERAWSSIHVREVAADAGRGRQTKSEGGSVKALKSRARGMSLPRSAFRTMSSSDESSQASPRTPISFSAAPPVRVVTQDNHRFRDSITSTSSSLYPRSTSSESYPESSIHPRSLKDKDEDLSSFSPRVVTHQASLPEFDVDDVSYRLRLLVNNSYFLPPAHSKPTPLSLAAPNAPAQRNPKQAAPGFLDFFRMGKSKSKPATPPQVATPADAFSKPVLRTTSDSTTASGYLPRTTPQTQQQSLAPTSFALPSNPGSRVVVLRERMDDLMEAAKQAERDIKLRGDGRKARSQATPRGEDPVDDVIDPTDVVDLPPPSSAYPFGIQASALHGLGPGESLGAAVLADRLPPSPGMWSMSSEEETWRKAILHEAVSLSLNDSPEASFSSVSPTSPEPSVHAPCFRDSVATDQSEEVPSPPTPKALIGQRILEPSFLDMEVDADTVLSPLQQALQTLPTSPSSQVNALPSAESSSAPWRSTAVPPRRAETPAATMPLTPPPPRKSPQSPSVPVFSAEITSEPETAPDVSSPTGPRIAFPSMESDEGSGRSAETHDMLVLDDADPDRRLTLSPPMMRPGESMLSFAAQLSSARASPYSEDDELSYATPMDGDDDFLPRESLTLSIPSERPSFSEFSHPSPTASAFQDAVFGSCRTPSPLLQRRSHVGSISQLASESETSPREAVFSQPPRLSTSLGAGTLPPPPRSPAIRPVYRPSTSVSSNSSHSAPRLGLGPESDLSHSRDAHEEPTFRPSLAARRGTSSSLSLHIPTDSIPPEIHTAPAPASPTAFFDRIQSHPNAMDDLDTSDDDSDDDLSLEAVSIGPDDDDESAEVFVDARTHAVSNRPSSSSSRPSIMRLGNHSTPQLTPRPSWEAEPVPPYDADRMRPIANVPERPTFFSPRKNKGKVVFPYDPSVFSHSRESLVAGSVSDDAASRRSGAGAGGSGGRPRSRSSSRPSLRPSTSSGPGREKVRAWQRESIQRFDGMLLDHIASEREAIKRIATNISNSRS